VSKGNGQAAIHVTVWGENLHEFRDKRVPELYPGGMHETIAAGIRQELGGRAVVRTATLDQQDNGLGDEVLGTTDVLTWWGHIGHDQVDDKVVERVRQRVLQGMGLVVLHSAHLSKIFRSLMGTSCNLRWRSIGERELVWTVSPGHEIVRGVPAVFAIEAQEMYGEFFDIPEPDELVFISSFTGGEVFRSGCCFYRGAGRIFFFGPGDQDYPVYHHETVKRVLANAVVWAYREGGPLAAPYEIELAEEGWIESYIREPYPSATK
jgi:trehalose utilization protein